MKLSESWLRELVNPPLNSNQLAEKLTMAGLEVDAITPVAGSFEGVVVAEVLETKPHPQAQRLTLCKVLGSKGQELAIVCGAANVRAGLKVALAEIGAVLPGGLNIKEAKLRGELSQGMLCSALELGLADNSEGIIELESDAPVGEDLRTYLNLDDTILDIDLTPNRADCLSLTGIAREVAALTASPLKAVQMTDVDCQSNEKKVVNVLAPDACPYYCGRVINDIQIPKSTPAWLKEKLRRSGFRSSNPIVDITNYVMLQLGQPLHAFDLGRIKGDIQLRSATKGEPVKLLDGRNLELTEHDVVIADSEKILALAGIMGSESSAVNEETTAIFLESAFFDPQIIAATARRHACLTDASQRFERGVDSQLAETALNYATSLLIDLTRSKAGPAFVFREASRLPGCQPVVFNPKRVKQLIGVDIPEKQMLESLEALGMIVTKSTGAWLVEIPSYRFDLRVEEDLIEEVIRLYGYDNIQTEKMAATLLPGKIHAVEMLSNQLARFFSTRGYHETISYSFVDPGIQHLLYPQHQFLTLINPLSPELSEMRAGMWSGLIASMVYNLHRQHSEIKLFETGTIFENNDGQLKESSCFAGLITGDYGSLNWAMESRHYDFYDLKGDLEALFAMLKVEEVEYIPEKHPALHPGISAGIYQNGKKLGWCGHLHPRLNDVLDIQQEVGLFELYLDKIQMGSNLSYRRISRFPQIRRDLSLLVDEKISVEQIQGVVKSLVSREWLKSMDIFDLYRGNSIPEGKKSLALALTLQDDDRTLVDLEINNLIDAIIKALDQQLAITLRDIS